jgi:nucleotide-binding universal stress UspA family protein
MVEPARSAKRVLLVIEGSGPALAAFAYALNLSRRTDAQLDILRVVEGRPEAGDAPPARDHVLVETQDVAGLRERLREAGIPHSIVMRHGDINEAVLNYTREHRVISALILDSATDGEVSAKTRRCAHLVRRISRYLAAPIVTVLPRAAEASRS